MATMPDSLRDSLTRRPARRMPPTTLDALREWVQSVAGLTQPARIHWCDGSTAEYEHLVDGMLDTGELVRLNPQTHPDCYLHRSSPSDVARVEHLTFVCTPTADEAGPNNHWMAPADAHAKMDALFAGCMRVGRRHPVVVRARLVRRRRAHEGQIGRAHV